jgi:hypothetical protein
MSSCETQITATTLGLKRSGRIFIWLKKRGEYQVHRATVTAMTRTLPPEEGRLVPSYYQERRLLRHVGFWTKIKDTVKLDSYDLRDLVVVASGTDVSYALRYSMAGHSLIRDVELLSRTSTLT